MREQRSSCDHVTMKAAAAQRGYVLPNSISLLLGVLECNRVICSKWGGRGAENAGCENDGASSEA